MPRDRYHHGDLAEALRAEAVRLIDEAGAEALSLRKLGLRLGVSRTALYRHYPDKSALLAAVAEEGFRSLSDRLAVVRAGCGGPIPRFQAMGLAYVEHAVDRPAHYRLMFSPVLDRELHPSLTAAATAAFGELAAIVEEGQAQGDLRDGPPQELAYCAWATVHGFAMLTIDRQVPPRSAWRALAQAVTRNVLVGLVSPGRGDTASI